MSQGSRMVGTWVTRRATVGGGSAMKVLVATSQGQGQDPDDHSWTTDGELVRLVDCPEPGCGYKAFAGIETHEATSTALVAERRDLDPDVLSLVFLRDCENQGLAGSCSEEELRLEIEQEVAYLVEHLRYAEPGAVVGRARGGLQVRQVMA